MMGDIISRDFVGYGNSPPEFIWPTAARVAINIVINFEEGAERNALDGDVELETLVESRYEVPLGERELFGESTFEYGSRVGVWRLLDVLTRYNIVPTVFACGLALARSPLVTQAFVARGCDFVGHGYRWIPHVGLSREDEKRNIHDCIQTIQRQTGQDILGWFTRPPNTINTRELLVAEGLIYDSGAVNDDLPYFQPVAGRPFLIVPYSLDVNDTRFFKNQFFTSGDFAEYAIDAFDTLWSESLHAPRMMSVGLHGRIIGRPGRIQGLTRFLDHVRQHEAVWVAPRDSIARFWLDSFAPPDAWRGHSHL